jgi:putative membrane protein
MLFLARLIVSAFALVLITYIVPGITVSGPYPALIAAFLLGIMNAIVRPVLVILTLPITLLTFGLFVFVINAALFMFVASFVEGFTVIGFVPALIGSLVMSIVSSVLNRLL